jgi:hypothetical protein
MEIRAIKNVQKQNKVKQIQRLKELFKNYEEI